VKNLQAFSQPDHRADQELRAKPACGVAEGRELR